MTVKLSLTVAVINIDGNCACPCLVVPIRYDHTDDTDTDEAMLHQNAGRGRPNGACMHARHTTVARQIRAPAVPLAPNNTCRKAAAPSLATAATRDGGSPAETAAAAGTVSSAAVAFSEPELRQLWDSVSRALLKLGKTGPTETHARSLGELVAAHKLVKVQINGLRDDPAAAAVAATALAQQAAGHAVLLQVKGSTMLFSSSSSSRAELLETAEAAAAGTAAWRARRTQQKAERAESLAATEAKRQANASRSRKKIGQIITTVAQPSQGPLDRKALASEWQQLASQIAAEEEAAAAAGQGGSGSKKQRQPWKKK